jgi:predicted HicB family RNase H-like nuclease
MTNAERYAVTVRKVVIENEELWRATVRELPDVAEFAETREQAIELALDSIESLKEAAVEEGRDFPEPIEDEEEFSGRVTLRMPKYLHRAVAQKALADDMSLNSYIVIVLGIDLAQRVRALSVPMVAATVKTGQSVHPKFEIAALDIVRLQEGLIRVGFSQPNVYTTTNTAFYVGAAQQMCPPHVLKVVDLQDVHPIYEHGSFPMGTSIDSYLDMQRKVG